MKLKDAKKMAIDLMTKHELTNWTFQFDNSKRRFGYCSHQRKIISLSAQLTELNDESTVKQIILHELAHALVSPRHNHNKVWLAKAREIGYTGGRQYGDDVKTPPKKWVAYCTNCDYQYESHNRSRQSAACGKCCKEYNHGRYSALYALKYKKNI